MPRVERLSIQVLCHATEDAAKVIKAVENILGPEAAKRVSKSIEALEGHYGDPIRLIRMYLLDRESAEQVFLKIILSLSASELEVLWNERSKKGKHGGKLYLRLDKQSAFLGRIKISDKDPIRIIVHVRGNVDIFKERLKAKLTS